MPLDGMRLFSVPAALIGASEQFFRRASTDVRSAMAAIKDASDVLALLLEGGRGEVAGRIAGAFRNAGQEGIADAFVFVYIHPYMDGNGRMGRFLMNVMLASGGYQWTIIPLERRNDYMAALEAASVGQDIRPFAQFLGGLVDARLHGQVTPSVPTDGGR